MSIPRAGRKRTPNRKLQELRLNAGLSPNDLGYRAGVSGKTIRAIEGGALPLPRTQFAIARVLNEAYGFEPSARLSVLDLWPLEVQQRPRVTA